MKFDTWMRLARVSPSDFAKMTGATRAMVYKWKRGNIGLQGLAQIQAITGGKVTPLDFAPKHKALGSSVEAQEARSRAAAATKETTS